MERSDMAYLPPGFAKCRFASPSSPSSLQLTPGPWRLLTPLCMIRKISPCIQTDPAVHPGKARPVLEFDSLTPPPAGTFLPALWGRNVPSPGVCEGNPDTPLDHISPLRDKDVPTPLCLPQNQLSGSSFAIRAKILPCTGRPRGHPPPLLDAHNVASIRMLSMITILSSTSTTTYIGTPFPHRDSW